MADDHRVPGADCFDIGKAGQAVSEFCQELQVGDFRADLVGMPGVKAFQNALQAIGQGIIGCGHAGKQRIAADGRNFAGNEDRAHGRRLVIGMVSVPVPAGRAMLIGLALDIGDFGISFNGMEVFVDVDIAKPAGKRQVAGWRDDLIAKENHAKFAKRAANVGELAIAHRHRQVDIEDLGTDRWRGLLQPDFAERVGLVKHFEHLQFAVIVGGDRERISLNQQLTLRKSV